MNFGDSGCFCVELVKLNGKEHPDLFGRSDGNKWRTDGKRWGRDGSRAGSSCFQISFVFRYSRSSDAFFVSISSVIKFLVIESRLSVDMRHLNIAWRTSADGLKSQLLQKSNTAKTPKKFKHNIRDAKVLETKIPITTSAYKYLTSSALLQSILLQCAYIQYLVNLYYLTWTQYNRTSSRISRHISPSI